MYIEDAERIANRLIKSITTFYKCEATIVGSIRRRVSVIKDIDILLTTKIYYDDFLDEIDFHETSTLRVDITSRGPRKIAAIITHHDIVVKCDIFYASGDEIPFALLHTTGSSTYNIRLRHLAKLQGLKLNQYGLFNIHSNKKLPHRFKTERDILEYLGSTKIDPRDR